MLDFALSLPVSTALVEVSIFLLLVLLFTRLVEAFVLRLLPLLLLLLVLLLLLLPPPPLFPHPLCC